MRKSRWLNSAWSLAALVIVAASGCGDGGGSSEGTNGSQSESSASSGKAGSSNHSVSVVENGVDTEPAQCVAIFLDSLRRGDERAANEVLTKRAREELAKTDYVIQPLGTPEGQYNIGRVGYPYEEKSVALVECTWTEPPVGNESVPPMDIVCQVHQEPEGWRISGLGVTIPGLNEPLLLDFEDAASLQATIDAATGQSPATQTNTAEQMQTGQQIATEVQQAAQLPSFPSMDTAATASQLPAFPDASTTTQQGSADPSASQGDASQFNLALPPAYNAPQNR